MRRASRWAWVLLAGLCLAGLHSQGGLSGAGPGAPASPPDADPAKAKRDADKPALTFVCFGDSLTGYRPHQSYQGVYLKYADLLGLMAEARVGLGTVQAMNAGWAGDATYGRSGQGMPGAVARLEGDVIKRKPDFATVLIAGNDRLLLDSDRDRTLNALRKMFAQLKRANVRTLVLTYPKSRPAPENRAKAWDLAKANPLIRKAAKEASFPVLDLEPHFARAVKEYPEKELVDPVDGVHFRPRGEMVVARALFAKLTDLGWIPPKTSKETPTR